MLIRRNSTVLFLMIALLLYVLPPLAAVTADFKTDVKATVAADINIDDVDFLPRRGEVDRLLETSDSFPTSRPRQEQEP